jgi:hypothetical protein
MGYDLASSAHFAAGWPYVFTGAGTPGAGNSMQPYGRPQNSPQLTVPAVSNPPPTAKVQMLRTIELTSQPDPWTYAFAGSTQPYGRDQNTSGVPGEEARPAPADRRRAQISIELVALAQSDPWLYLFMGAMGPYVPARLDALDKAVTVNNPPPSASRPVTINLELAAIAQPDSWTYAWLGTEGWLGPYMPSKGPWGTFANLPAFDRRALPTLQELAAVNQADPWTYLYFGALGGPYLPNRSLANPGFEARAEPFPPDPAIAQQPLIAQATFQPDPYQFAGQGGDGPYLPKPLNAQIVFVEVDQPQPVANLFAIIQAQWINLPDPWTFSELGGAGPYQARQLNPQITAVEVDVPPPTLLSQIDTQFYLASQPDPWTYAFIGSAQPYTARITNEALFASPPQVPIDQRDVTAKLILDAWTPPDPIAANYPPQPYRQRVTVRLGRGRAFIIS